MQKLKTPYIASTPPDFLWARRILAAVVVLALLLGIAASIDAISSSLSTPERTVRTTTGQAFELYGEIPASSDGMRPAVRFDIRPSAPQIVVNRIDFHPTRDQRSLKWTATLMALPGTPSGFYNIRPASSSAENLPGWHCDISSCRTLEDLPKEALDYIRYLEKAVGCPIKYVSVGAEREQYLTL